MEQAVNQAIADVMQLGLFTSVLCGGLALSYGIATLIAGR